MPILHDHLASGEERPIYLFYGARTQRDLFHLERLAELTDAHPTLTFVPVLSHEAEDASWQGERGFVHERVNDWLKRLDVGGVGDVYACPFVIHDEFLAGNVRDTEWNEEVFKASATFERGGVKIAVIGQAFPYTPVANPRWMIPKWEFGIREEDMQKQVDEARAHRRVRLDAHGRRGARLAGTARLGAA